MASQTTYHSYLRLSALLDQQVPLSVPACDDEVAFIVVHQACELWFKVLIADLTAVRDAMAAGDVVAARRKFVRVHAVHEVLLAQIPVLEAMRPADFLAFRDALAPASGIESAQYREIEFLSGLKDPVWLRRLPGLTAGERDRLERRLAEPSLWDAFVRLLAHRGLPVETGRLPATLSRLTSGESETELAALARDLIAHDEAAAAWRRRHLEMAERFIGDSRGTGGTSGAGFLGRRLGLRFYPLLAQHAADVPSR